MQVNANEALSHLARENAKLGALVKGLFMQLKISEFQFDPELLMKATLPYDLAISKMETDEKLMALSLVKREEKSRILQPNKELIK